jgi:hypothetical protein
MKTKYSVKNKAGIHSPKKAWVSPEITNLDIKGGLTDPSEDGSSGFS